MYATFKIPYTLPLPTNSGGNGSGNGSSPHTSYTEVQTNITGVTQNGIALDHTLTIKPYYPAIGIIALITFLISALKK